MTGYQSKKAAAQAIDKVNWADHEPDGRRAAALDKPLTKEHGFINYAHQLMVKCFNEEYAAPPQRQPLTDDQIKEIWLNGKDHGDDWLDVQGIARAIEAAHGITE